jgi:hypothetical protein
MDTSIVAYLRVEARFENVALLTAIMSPVSSSALIFALASLAFFSLPGKIAMTLDVLQGHLSGLAINHLS